MPSAQQASASRSVELEANFVAVGRRFACCVNASARDDLQSIKWMTGTIRAATETDSNNEEQQYCVEWDGKDPLREYEWIYPHETAEDDRYENVNGGNYSCFLIEDKLMWCETEDSTGASTLQSASKGSKAVLQSPKQFRPASTYLALVDHIDYHARNRVPVHLLAENSLDFVDKDQLYVFPVQDRQTSLSVRGDNVPVIKDHQIAINHWFEARRNQQRLIHDKDKQLIGQSVQVYWKDGASQRWYSACLKSYNSKDQTVTVMDYNVIQDRKVDPRLEEIRIVRDTGRSALSTTSSSPTPGTEINSRARRPSRQLSSTNKSEHSEKSSVASKKRKATTSPKRAVKKPGRKPTTSSTAAKNKTKRLMKAESGQKRPRGRPPLAKKATPARRRKAANKKSSIKNQRYSSDEDDVSSSEDEADNTRESEDETEKDNDEDDEIMQEENEAQSIKNKRATESPSIESDDDDEPSWSLSKLSNKRIKSITRASEKSAGVSSTPAVTKAEPAPPDLTPTKAKKPPKKQPVKEEVKEENDSSMSGEEETVPEKKNGKTNGRAGSAKSKAKSAKREKSNSRSPSRNIPSRGKKQPLSYKEDSEESMTELEGSQPTPVANPEPVLEPVVPPIVKEEKVPPPFNPLNIRKVRPRKPAEKKKPVPYFAPSGTNVAASAPAADTVESNVSSSISSGASTEAINKEIALSNLKELEVKSPALAKPSLPPVSPPSYHSLPNKTHESPPKKAGRVAAQPQEQVHREDSEAQPVVHHGRGHSSHSEQPHPSQAPHPHPTFPPNSSHQPLRHHDAASSHALMYEARPHAGEAGALSSHGEPSAATSSHSSVNQQRNSAQANFQQQQPAAFSMTPSPFRATTPSPFVPRNAPVNNPQQPYGQSTSQTTAYRPSPSTYTSQGQQSNAAAAYFSPYANPAFFYPGHIGSPAGFAGTTPVMYGSPMYANAMHLPGQGAAGQWDMMMIQNPLMAGLAMQHQPLTAAGGNNRGGSMRTAAASPETRQGAGSNNPLTGVISGAMQALNNFSIPSPPLGVAAYSPYLVAAGGKHPSSGLHGQPSQSPSPHALHNKESPKEGPRASSTHSTHSSSSGGRRTNRTPELSAQGAFQARASPQSQYFMPNLATLPPAPEPPKGRGQSSSSTSVPKAQTSKRRQAQPKEKAAESVSTTKEPPKKRNRKKATVAPETQNKVTSQVQLPINAVLPMSKEANFPPVTMANSAMLGEPCPLTMLSTIATFHDSRCLTGKELTEIGPTSDRLVSPPLVETVHREKSPVAEVAESEPVGTSLVSQASTFALAVEESEENIQKDATTDDTSKTAVIENTVVNSDDIVAAVVDDVSIESTFNNSNDVVTKSSENVGQVVEVTTTEVAQESNANIAEDIEQLSSASELISKSVEERVEEPVKEPTVEPIEVTVAAENSKEGQVTKPSNGSHVPLVSYASSDEEDDNPRLRICDESQDINGAKSVSPKSTSTVVISETPVPINELRTTGVNNTEDQTMTSADIVL